MIELGLILLFLTGGFLYKLLLWPILFLYYLLFKNNDY